MGIECGSCQSVSCCATCGADILYGQRDHSAADGEVGGVTDMVADISIGIRLRSICICVLWI